MTLDQVRPGSEFIIAGLTARGEIRKRMVDMGFTTGAQGTLLRKAMFGGPIELRLGQSLVAVRITEAQKVQLQA
jgi:ferrous iron transport protein A